MSESSGGKKLTMSQLAALMKASAKKVDPEINKNLRTMAQAGVGIMKREIQGMHAVDTGTMVNSVSAENVGDDVVYIGPTVDYAVFVALGTRWVEARPFHITSARKLRKLIKDLDLNLGV